DLIDRNPVLLHRTFPDPGRDDVGRRRNREKAEEENESGRQGDRDRKQPLDEAAKPNARSCTTAPAALAGSIGLGGHRRGSRSRSAFAITETEKRLMAPEAIIDDRNIAVKGCHAAERERVECSIAQT